MRDSFSNSEKPVGWKHLSKYHGEDCNSDNLLLFRKETSKDSLKKLKQKFSLKKKRGIV